MTHILTVRSKDLGEGYGAVLYYDQKKKKYGVETADQGVSVSKKEYKSKKSAEKAFEKIKSKEMHSPNTYAYHRPFIANNAKSKLRSIT